MTERNEAERYRDALVWAIDTFKAAGDTHGCDYCRADAATLRRVLGEGWVEVIPVAEVEWRIEMVKDVGERAVRAAEAEVERLRSRVANLEEWKRIVDAS